MQQLLYDQGFTFGGQFRAEERHIYTFPVGHAFKMEWNVGFEAGDSEEDDLCRLGLGFRWNKIYGDDGHDHYSNFVMAVFNNKTEANDFLRGLGDFFQPEEISPGTSLTDWISKDNDLNNEDDWRFFGKRLSPADPNDRAILENSQRLALEAARVFKTIKNTKFFQEIGVAAQ